MVSLCFCQKRPWHPASVPCRWKVRIRSAAPQSCQKMKSFWQCPSAAKPSRALLLHRVTPRRLRCWSLVMAAVVRARCKCQNRRRWPPHPRPQPQRQHHHQRYLQRRRLKSPQLNSPAPQLLRPPAQPHLRRLWRRGCLARQQVQSRLRLLLLLSPPLPPRPAWL